MSPKSKTPTVDAKAALATASNAEATASQLDQLDGVSVAVDRLLAKHPHASPALLERLSHSSDKTTRKNVVLNASSPKETLVRLAPQFPADFFLNPAFDWLLFEDPDLVKNLGQGVRKNVLKRPECPESLMSWAVEKGSDEERLAVAMNPAASADLVARLSRLPGKVGEAARSHVNAAASSPPEPADGRGVVQAEVRAALAELTADEARSYWKRGIVGPSKWACLSLRARLDVLGLDDWVYRDDWLAQQAAQLASLTDESLKDWLKSRQRMSDPDHAAAMSARSAPADLERLAAATSPGLVALAARNPSMPAAVLGRLALDKRTDVRAAVAANESTPAETLQQLAKDKQASVRAEAAGNPALAMDTVLDLAKDKAAEVKQAAKAAAAADMRAARSVRTLADQLARLAGAKKAEVRLAVARNPSTPEDARTSAFASLLAEAGPNKLMDYADEPSCPADVRDRARARRWWWELCRAVEKHALPDGAEPLPAEPDIDTLVQMLRAESAAMLLTPGQTLLARSLGFREGDLLAIPGDEADTACNAKARAVRLMGLMHPLAGPEAMAKRSRSTDWVERLAIACNPACAASILNGLEKDANQTVARQVASTRVAKGSEQERKAAIVRSQPEVEVSLAPVVDEIRKRLGKCRTWLLQGSAWWPSLNFQQRLGRPDWRSGLKHISPAGLIEVLEALSSLPAGEHGSKDPIGGIWNWRQRDALEPIADRLFTSARHLKALAASPDPYVREAAASNPNLEEADAIALSKDPFDRVRRAAITGGKLPADVLIRMLDDGDSYVRAAAIERAALTDQVIGVLSQSRSVEVRVALASNRALPHAVQAQLAQDKNHDVRRSLAANPSVSHHLLASLAADKKWEVRGAAATNPSISADALDVLASDKDEWVRRHVAGNPVASVGLLIRLANDREIDVRTAAERQLQERSGISDGELELMLVGKTALRMLAASNRHIPMNLMRQLAAGADPWVRRWLALNHGAPAEILALLADDQDDNVKEGALAHRNAPLSAIERAAKDKDPRFRRAVATNPSAPAHLLEDLASDPDPAVRLDLLRNPCLPRRLLDRLTPDVDSMEKYFPALVNAARSPWTRVEELQRLAHESFLIVRFVALANPRYPESAREADRAALHEEVLSGTDALPPTAAAASEPELRRALQALELLPEKPDAKWAAKAAKSKDWLARFAVPLSGVAQPSLLQLLIEDPVDVVRQLAIGRLREGEGEGGSRTQPAPLQ